MATCLCRLPMPMQVALGRPSLAGRRPARVQLFRVNAEPQHKLAVRFGIEVALILRCVRIAFALRRVRVRAGACVCVRVRATLHRVCP